MKRWVLLLRGVNVGKGNVLPTDELRAMLEKLECADVRTYVQSGNAVFSSALPAAPLTEGIERALERYMGRPIDTTLRTRPQMAAIVAGNPFERVARSHSNLCVTFLSHRPRPSEVAPLQARDFGPELFRIEGREIYTWHPNGQGESPLREALWKLPLRGAVTTRNWNTVRKLVEMLA